MCLLSSSLALRSGASRSSPRTWKVRGSPPAWSGVFVGGCLVLRLLGLLYLAERFRFFRWVLGLFVTFWVLFVFLVAALGVVIRVWFFASALAASRPPGRRFRLLFAFLFVFPRLAFPRSRASACVFCVSSWFFVGFAFGLGGASRPWGFFSRDFSRVVVGASHLLSRLLFAGRSPPRFVAGLGVSGGGRSPFPAPGAVPVFRLPLRPGQVGSSPWLRCQEPFR